MSLTYTEICILYEEGNLEKYITDVNKNDVLWWASEYGHLGVVKYLVEKYGAGVRVYKDNAVRWASKNGHFEVVKYLVEKCGADVRACNDWVLWWSSGNGHLEVVKYLVEKCGAGVRVDYAVRWASKNGHLELVKYLVEKCGADVRADNDYAVRWASVGCHLEVVKYLINHGAVLSTPNPKYEKYILVCEKRREKASKKIYFWWVQVCYDVKRPCGNRMMRRNYEEYNKIVFENKL